MRVHVIEHVPYETAANIGVWARQRGHEVAVTKLYAGETLPESPEFDWLVIMGGPMGTYEKGLYPWLDEEVRFIRRTVDAGKVIVGVCLGAQLLAEALGARVGPHREREIGWFPVRLTDAGKASGVFSALPEQFEAFHWHGDTFDLPDDATHTASSEATPNQAFEFGGRAFGLQFHLDYSAESIQLMLDSSDVLAPGPFVQSPDAMLPAPEKIAATERMLFALLDRIAETSGRG